jgi:DNA-binding SARP family transcriptional activator
LLFIACQPSEGVSREAVLEAIWPDDSGDADVAHRVRQLRYRLRIALENAPGKPDRDPIWLVRGGAVRLDPTIARSDVQVFLDGLRSARISTGHAAIASYEQVRALYTGDLLDGPDAHRYSWLVERGADGVTLREHFRRLYEQVTASLAELYASVGNPAAAIETYRELTELDPGNDRHWLALFRLLAQCGDRHALIREERRMRETQASLDPDGYAEPSRELVKEFKALLSRLDEEVPAAAAV